MPGHRRRDHGRRHHRRHGSRSRSSSPRRSHRDRSPKPGVSDMDEAEFRNYLVALRRRFRIHSYGISDVNNERAGTQDQDKKPDPAKVLTVKNVDLKITANGKAHRTSEYEISAPYKRNPKLVIRRGQPFNIDLDFSRKYDPKTDDLRIVFELGDRPLVSKKTKVEFILSDVDKPKEWGAKILSAKDNTLSVTVFTPPTCLVGAWKLKIDLVKKEDNDVNIFRYKHEDKIYIIFNPWCKDDDVYMGDEEMLKEYILNESGRIYSGSRKNITHKPWNFGQFESCVLDVALYLLDVSDMNIATRGNPIPVVRKLSAMVNSSDDGGILAGNWSGDYSGGRSPLSWTGSVAILEQYWKRKQPVLYGQCWVFSGVTTSILRALGIPARSVTNFASAHDTDGSITIDLHFNLAGEAEDDLNYDSVWNFHVWNEAWMARPDLPSGYGGWQAIDATPQEVSDGIYCCGPVSVQAIKQGEVNMPYDAPFVFAEVNADRVYWQPDYMGNLQVVYVEEKCVGKFISTKAPNSKEREDVTLNYKPEEGSAAERACVLKANQVGSTCEHKIYETAESRDVAFSVVQDSANSWVGDPFVVSLHMKNKSKKPRSVSGRLVVKTMFYTGVTADKIKSDAFQSIVLKPGEESTKTVTVTPEEYTSKLKDGCMLDVSAWATVEETRQIFTAKEDFRLRKPHLTVKAPKEAVKGKEFKVEVSFKNPLDVSLTNGFIEVDGLATSLSFPQGTVAPKGTLVATLPITAQKVGQKELILAFNSAQLEDINASCDVFVRGV